MPCEADEVATIHRSSNSFARRSSWRFSMRPRLDRSLGLETAT
jgi:hypothetical protein